MRIAPLTTDHAETLADLHGRAFARPWASFEFERMLADRAVVADGIFQTGAHEPFGFVLSRRVLDEAEILTVTIRPIAGPGHAGPLMRHHLDDSTSPRGPASGRFTSKSRRGTPGARPLSTLALRNRGAACRLLHEARRHPIGRDHHEPQALGR
jgi:hypothetical protein